MKVLIVYAHHEPKSFNSALKELAVSVLSQTGHSVQISDLYAMNFKAIADGADFSITTKESYLRYGSAQKHAFEAGHLTADITQEMEKLQWADFVILQFPLWWFSVPAILKGWVDRVFVTSFAFTVKNRYDRGLLKGRRALLSLTTGSPQTSYEKNGLNGDMDMILYHIHHGMLNYVGFEVLPPFVAYSVEHASDEERESYLEAYKQRLLTLEETKPLELYKMEDFDETLRLKQA